MKKAYSIVIWLNVPGPQTSEEEELEYLADRRAKQGARSFVFNAPAASRLVYGAYDSLELAENALQDLETHISEGRSIRVVYPGEDDKTVFLVPATSIYYVAMASTEQA